MYHFSQSEFQYDFSQSKLILKEDAAPLEIADGVNSSISSEMVLKEEFVPPMHDEISYEQPSIPTFDSEDMVWVFEEKSSPVISSASDEFITSDEIVPEENHVSSISVAESNLSQPQVIRGHKLSQCVICGIKITTQNLKRHIKTVHNKDSVDKHKSKCPICGDMFPGNNRKRHMKDLHGIDVPPLKAPREAITSSCLKKLTNTLKKPPNAPEKPVAAYMRFSREVWHQARKNNPGTTLGGLGKIIGEMWRNLANNEKQKYHDAFDSEQVNASLFVCNIF